jgi:hypothetical protein
MNRSGDLPFATLYEMSRQMGRMVAYAYHEQRPEMTTK